MKEELLTTLNDRLPSVILLRSQIIALPNPIYFYALEYDKVDDEYFWIGTDIRTRKEVVISTDLINIEEEEEYSDKTEEELATLAGPTSAINDNRFCILYPNQYN